LTATPVTGHAFNFWSGDASGTNNPLGVSMTTNKTISAHFATTEVNIRIEGQGRVSKSPDNPFYNAGEPVTLTATPGRWFDFTGWGDGPTVNPRVITIGASNSYMAIFSSTTAVETLTFNGVMRLAPVGMPSIFVDGQFMASTGAVTRLGLAQISLLTTFTNGSIFFTLDGSAPSFFSSLYQGPFALSHSAAVRAVAYDANFLNSWEVDPVQVIILPTYLLNATTPGGGTVHVTPAAASYVSNTLVTVTAIPAPGWTFLLWLGDVAATNASNTLRFTRNLCARALFGTPLDATVTGNGVVTVDPVAALYPYGSAVRLTALPQPGHSFVAWGNAGSGTNNPLLFTVTNANPTVSCLFALLSARQFSLAVLVNGHGHVTATPHGNRFNSGQSVTLTAIPDADQDFLGWSGDASGTENPLALVMNQSRVINASFTKHPRLSLGPCLGGLYEDGFQLTLTGEFGARYGVDAAAVLPNWSPVATVTNVWGTVQFSDPAGTNLAQRFYRVWQEP
jgi:hypothetical protein